MSVLTPLSLPDDPKGSLYRVIGQGQRGGEVPPSQDGSSSLFIFALRQRARRSVSYRVSAET